MTVADDTIPMDVSDDFDGNDAFLASFDDEPKKKVPSEGDEEASDTPPETEEVDADTTETEDEAEADPDDPDNQEIEIKVGEEVKKAKLRDLKRLYGQEASLTQKSQAASARLAEAEAQSLRATTATTALLKRAEAAYEPYKNLDAASWALLANQMTPENFNQLREDANAALTNVKFLGEELDGLVKADQQKTEEVRKAEVAATLAELNHPETGIKGWGAPLYNELVSYADKNGLPQFRSVTTAAAIRLMRKAMLYDKQQEAAKAAASKVKVAVDKSKNVLRPGASKPTSQDANLSKAMKVLRSTGDTDAAADAFAASF